MTRRKKRTTKAENFVYSHDELVSLIKKHYQLLIDMAYFEPEDVRWPPEPAGWSDEDLNVNALQILGRDIKVIQLLRHIPYPRKKNTEVYFASMAISYLHEHWQPENGRRVNWHKRSFCALGLAPFDGPMPPHLITLTCCVYPHADEYYLFDDEPAEVDEQQMWWLKAKALSFKEFFDKIRTQISSLTLVPAPAAGDLGKSILQSGDSGSEGIKNLYHECGWPGPLRKEEFLQEVLSVREAGMQELSSRYDEFQNS
ncbi:hypothetical protein CSIM01_05632 [Colletotrichum simmondsii]|uniref:Uncharacterized protein n=1 Tax=Colletotrichum simmondsii TaxID=703756 RepID=A0A135SRS1_9PEZI|nr:hypothetical protein CSIM01_05632 [Colletotrichum simmondsii]